MTQLRAWFLALVTTLMTATLAMATPEGAGKPIESGHHLQKAVTPVMEDIIWLDNFLHGIMIVIVIFVTALMVYCVVKFTREKNPEPSTFTHNATLEVVWTAIPVVILVIIAIPSLKLLFEQLEVPEPDLTIKATGVQWGWAYEYPDEGVEFESYMIGSPSMAIPDELADEDFVLNYGYNEGVQKLLDHYEYNKDEFLLATDTRVKVPVNATVHMLVTAADVIHAWTIPSFGSKIDAMPGRINETWFKATEIGVYFGQCSELCGQAHSYMPIVVEVVSQEDYDTWVLEMAAKQGDTQFAKAE